jgi:hypothetical protein
VGFFALDFYDKAKEKLQGVVVEMMGHLLEYQSIYKHLHYKMLQFLRVEWIIFLVKIKLLKQV